MHFCYTKGAMKFSNLRVKELKSILKHTPSVKSWHVKDRVTHIVGIQLEGKMFHTVGERSITLSAGDVFFFNAKDDFHATVKELGTSYTVHFTTDQQIETESFAYHTSTPKEFTSILDGIEREASPKGIDGNLALSLFYRLCFLIDEHMTQAYRPPDARVKAAEEYLRLHFTEKDALACAVREASLSARRFGTLFKAQYGTTPGKYLTALRIAAAKKAIVSSELSVKQVAEACGFSDLYYFSKSFKKETGVSPTDFRRNNV